MNLHYFYLKLRNLTDSLETSHPEAAEELDVLCGELSGLVHPFFVSDGLGNVREVTLEELYED